MGPWFIKVCENFPVPAYQHFITNVEITDRHSCRSSSGDASVDDDIVIQLRRMSPFPKPPAVLFTPSKPLLPVADKWIFPRP